MLSLSWLVQLAMAASVSSVIPTTRWVIYNDIVRRGSTIGALGRTPGMKKITENFFYYRTEISTVTEWSCNTAWGVMQVSLPTQISNELMPVNTSEFLPSIPTLILSSVSWMEDFLVTSSKLSSLLPSLRCSVTHMKIFVVQPSHFMQDIWITHWKLSWNLAYGNLNGPTTARPVLLRQQ